MNGVVFDFDGVLGDSEPLSWAAWTVTLRPYGIEISDEDVAACTGTTSKDTYAYFAPRAPLPAYPDVLDAVDRHRQAAYPTKLRPFPDALDAVQALAMVGVPLAVASSSSRKNLDIKLRVLGLGRYFDVTVAGDEVERGKPSPDIYLRAVEKLRIDPGTSIAVEDTGVGADAAAAAGLRTVIVNRMDLPTGRHPVVSQVDPDMLLLWLGRI
jgi:HAD superfamily hydrolase (TIGR01509 family)